ncbi:hypothetical protein CTKA_02614 [Chthonomonas calidirosea]|uniref:RnfC Barrel sandwich hybrid domain-containing protein n=1 Tax=Chthonomonas calidirosea (strain DSM 23976 / ICMP 18418 / T49) TaxID=1303518 RepID=S0EYY2_CHTCT|nr:hypothetical protein [Chthonomonas calidirosea]CCW35301.1 hypothetical protein CCALI_01485 [Chthonomonas calidirosea T49]CEK20668.1 hypothetical protein CTKA_02614 [Chthonomonas calidirosea]
MSTAYTPGLKVSSYTHIEKERRLPVKGRVLVKEGDAVWPDTVVARAELPSPMQTIRLAAQLGIEPSALPTVLKMKQGDQVQKGDLLAETRGLFGRFFRSRFYSPLSGTLELISPTTGNIGIRPPPLPVEQRAYVRGHVLRVLPQEGVVIHCTGALVQGIFGVGGERLGTLHVVTSGPDSPLTEHHIHEKHQGGVVVGGSLVTPEALRKAAEMGVAGIVCGGIVDTDLIAFLADTLNDPNYDIGVAITGQEPIPFTLILTEGFGPIPMAERTFRLFCHLEGQQASINGATQIRAGVLRPEVIVPLGSHEDSSPEADTQPTQALAVGTPIRLIRAPYFGAIGEVAELPTAPEPVESGAVVRVLRAKLADGRVVTVPRANVEIIEVV